MDLKSTWPAQEQQDSLAKVEITVDGDPAWEIFLAGNITLSGAWVKWCGGTEVPLLNYLRVEARINEVSFERCVLGAFLDRGYNLEALVVEFDPPHRKEWGKCTWCKEHPAYDEPLTGIFEGVSQEWASFIYSRFKTEHAGEQKFSLFSTQMIGAAIIGKDMRVLLHKTLIFHKVALSSPKQDTPAAAA